MQSKRFQTSLRFFLQNLFLFLLFLSHEPCACARVQYKVLECMPRKHASRAGQNHMFEKALEAYAQKQENPHTVVAVLLMSLILCTGFKRFSGHVSLACTRSMFSRHEFKDIVPKTCTGACDRNRRKRNRN